MSPPPLPILIAEMANAHEGDQNNALALLEQIGDSTVTAIKFQMIIADELATPDYAYYDLYQRLEEGIRTFGDLVTRAQASGLEVITDIFGLQGLELASQFGVDSVKIHAADIANQEMLRRVSTSFERIYLSTGGSTFLEIRKALSLLTSSETQIILIEGIQRYPTKLEDLHLARIRALKKQFQLPVLFASHLPGGSADADALPLIALAAGADGLELHITLDRSKEGLDYYSSYEPSEFHQISQRIQHWHSAWGAPSLELTEAEQLYRNSHRKVVVADKPLDAGAILTSQDVSLRRVPFQEDVSYAYDIDQVLNTTLLSPLKPNQAINMNHTKQKIAAVIACRSESSRMYAKPFQHIGDQTILEHLITRLKNISSLDDIVLAIADTPSQHSYQDFAEKHSLPFVIGSEDDVLSRLINGADSIGATTLIRVTSDCPFIYWDNVDEMTRLHLDQKNDLTVTDGLPIGAIVEVINVNALKTSHRLGENRHRSEFCTLFISEHPSDFKIQVLSAPDNVNRPDYRLTIDHPEDLLLCRTIHQKLTAQGKDVSLPNIVALLDSSKELLGINASHQSLYLWSQGDSAQK